MGSLTTAIGSGKVTNTMLAGSITVAKLSATGTPGSTNFLRGDGTWSVPPATASGSDGYVQFAASSLLSSDSALFWDNSNKRLGIGTATPSTALQVVGTVTATTFAGSGASLTSLPAANLTGTLPAISGASLTSLTAANLTGALPAISGASLTSLNASNLSSGTVGTARLGTGTANSSSYLRGDGTWTTPAYTSASGSDGSIQFAASSAFSSDSALFWDNTNKRLGIGTATPASQLHVIGGATLSGACHPGWLSSTLNLDYCPAGGGARLQAYAASSAVTNILLNPNGGNIGIGTTAPNFLQQLHKAATSSAVYTQHTNGSTGATASDGMLVGVDSANDAIVWMQESANIKLATNNTERMRIDSSGKVGIGTTSPGAPLNVYTNTFPQIQVDTTALNSKAGLYLNGGLGSGAWMVAANASGVSDEFALQYFAGAFGFQQYFMIDINGNVGLGVGTATNMLSLNGDAARTIWMERNTATNTAGSALTVQAGGATSGATNKNGGDLVLSSGIATGSGTSNITFKTFPAGSSGTTSGTATTALTITGAGAVGIGTSSPVGGGLHVAAAVTRQLLLNRADIGTSVTDGTYMGTGSGDFIIDNQEAGALRLATNDTEQMRITSSGNVGIGNSTPGSKLDVSGSVNIGDRGDGCCAQLVETAASPGRATHFYTYTSGDFQIHKYGASSVGGAAFTITNAGNVGIGTTSPATYIDSGLAIYGSGTMLSWNTSLSGSTRRNWGIATEQYTAGDWNLFVSSAAGSKPNTAVMTASSGGNIGIGITTPLSEGAMAKLSIVGTAAQVATTLAESNTKAAVVIRGNANSGYAINMGAATGDLPYVQGAVFGGGAAAASMLLNPFGGNVGIGTSSPSYLLHVNGTAYATGAAGALSDARHKKDILTLKDGALQAVAQLRPVTFQWIKPADKGMQGQQRGFIAQEVEKILPEMVLTEDNKEKTKGLKYNEFIPVLVKAMQELKADNDNLKLRVKTLESQAVHR